MSYRVDYIGASWCKVCKIIFPDLERLLTEYSIPLKTFDVDLDNLEDIKKVPTVRLYKDDTLIKEIVTEHLKALKSELVVMGGIKLNMEF